MFAKSCSAPPRLDTTGILGEFELVKWLRSLNSAGRIAGTKNNDSYEKQLIPAFLAAALLTAQSVMAAEQTDIGQADRETLEKVFAKKAGYSPTRAELPHATLFGDTHLHTSFSIDAGAFGCRLSPRDAYRFARGEEITASSGQPVKLSRPLD